MTNEAKDFNEGSVKTLMQAIYDYLNETNEDEKSEEKNESLRLQKL